MYSKWATRTKDTIMIHDVFIHLKIDDTLNVHKDFFSVKEIDITNLYKVGTHFWPIYIS